VTHVNMIFYAMPRGVILTRKLRE